MADQFNVSINQICGTFTGFSAAFTISQLFYDTLSDFIGKKPVLISGLILAAFATVLCMYANT